MKKIWPLGLLVVMGSIILGFAIGDRPAAPTIGFFLNGWQPRNFEAPAWQSGEKPAAATATLRIEPDSVITRIPLTVFAQNANTWMGTMTTQPTLMTNLTNLQPHVIRWPAGSGSDGYFWDRGPGLAPSDVPDTLLDRSGKPVEPHWFYGRSGWRSGASLDDYYAMLKQTGNEGLITVNYGYARYGTSADPVATAAHYAANWVRYDHGRTRYWEIGNENYGTWELGYRIDTTINRDGQPKLLTGELYGRQFMVFADSMRKAAAEVGTTIAIGAVTLDAPPSFWEGANARNWNTGMMRSSHDKADYYVVHSYFTPYNKNSTGAEIIYDAEVVPGRVMGYVLQCLRESGAAVKPVAMDEWNMFAVGSRQQVSNVSGLFGVLVIGEALRNKFGLAARWDLYNGWAGGNDHGLFSAGDEPGVQRWAPRPSFYYLYYLQRMLGDRLVGCRVEGDTSLRAYASTFSSGEVGAVLVNTSRDSAVTVGIDGRGLSKARRYYWYSLEGGDDNGEFSARVMVNGVGPDGSAGGPADYATMRAYSASAAHGIRVTVPARGAVFLVAVK